MKEERICLLPSLTFENPALRLAFIMRGTGLNYKKLVQLLDLPGGPEELYRLTLSRTPMMPLHLAILLHNQFPFIDLKWLLTGCCSEKQTAR